MKVIGLLGGMSWESSSIYYRIINQEVRKRLGGLHSAQIVLWSVDFARIAALQNEGNWQQAARELSQAAKRLKAAGAECLLICTNTMHKIAGELTADLSIPLLHVADCTAERAKSQGITRVGLLGTRYTMEQDFYRDRLSEHGLTVTVPHSADRETVHRIIFQELCQGVVTEESRSHYRRIIRQMADDNGIEGVILGCTEISMLVSESDSCVPLFDTTRIHAEAAVEFALGSGSGEI